MEEKQHQYKKEYKDRGRTRNKKWSNCRNMVRRTRRNRKTRNREMNRKRKR